MRAYCHHCKLETEEGHPTPEDCIAALLVENARLRAALEEYTIFKSARKALEPHP